MFAYNWESYTSRCDGELSHQSNQGDISYMWTNI